MSPGVTVTGLLRNRGELLLLCYGDTGRWDGVTGGAAGDPAEAVRREIRDETGLDETALTRVRRGNPFTVDGRDGRVHPFLFDCEHRDIESGETTRTEWVSPPAILDRETVPGLWECYDRVRPRAETVANDTEHGSAYVSMRVLEVLRDEAALRARGTTEPDGAVRSVGTLARELLTARPAMTAVANRVHRAMADDPATIERAAHGGIERAARVDREAATVAASRLGGHVATLSRSGTVRRTLALADPDRVLVAESRPGREGVEVAADLAVPSDDIRVTLTTDAGFPAALADHDVETLVVGADAVLADGRVVNKVGTRGAALAATYEGMDVVVVTASDKISPGTDWDPEERDPAGVYDGDASVSVANPTFDVTPAEVVDAVVTERGALDTDEVRAIADQHRAFRDPLTGE